MDFDTQIHKHQPIISLLVFSDLSVCVEIHNIVYLESSYLAMVFASQQNSFGCSFHHHYFVMLFSPVSDILYLVSGPSSFHLQNFAE